MLEKLLRKLLIPVVAGITACSSPSDNSSGCLVDSDCLSGRYCRKEEGQKYGVCAFHEDILGGDVSPEVIGCGNSVCEEGENCSSCPQDCGECKQLCEPCEGDYQCGDGSGKDMCINFPDSKSLYYNKKKFCAQECSTEACPTGYDCMDVFSEAEKVNKKRCALSLYAGGVNFPACTNGETCDPSKYVSFCDEDGKVHFCSETLKLIKISDCDHYGLKCGTDKQSNRADCFGYSQLGEPCPEWYDCDATSTDFCVSVGSGLSTYCSKICKTETDCPDDFFCELISTGKKVCSPKN